MQCVGQIFGDYRFRSCTKNGTVEHDGRMYCKTHHPPTVEVKSKDRHERWQAEWKAEDKATADAKRESTIGRLAAEWMRTEHPEIVEKWEQELSK